MSTTGHSCLSVFGKVANGVYFTPFGQDICRKCKCLAGKAVGCINETCPDLPNCAHYEQVDGKCCEFKCLEGDGLSNKSELAVILSLSIGLVLLLVILITILYCRRRSVKKEKRQEVSEIKPQSSIEQVQPNNTAPVTQPNNTTTSEVNNEERPRQAEIELPPPYFPPENLANVNQKRTRQPLPPNEPPPPYDREESSV